jgi:hypothetical protein
MWSPLFDDIEAADFEGVVRSIADALASRDTPPTDWGRTLLHSYLALAGGAGDHESTADQLLDEAIVCLGTGVHAAGLYGGIAGIGWLAAHVDRIFNREGKGAYEEVDKAMLAFCRRTGAVSELPYDLISGPVGAGVYFLERLPDELASHGLKVIAADLETRAERNGGLRTWFTAPEALRGAARDVAPSGYYNVGVAHGVPGVVALFGEMITAGVHDEGLKDSVREASHWILRQHLGDGRYPSWVIPGVAPVRSRVAWCYGELGVAVALLVGARSIEDSTLIRESTEIGLKAAARRIETGTVDASLCHGAAGNGHLFNRLYQATRREEFRAAAIFWFRRVLEMRKPGIGIAGYQMWSPSPRPGGANYWADDPTFLTGVAGVALTLLAAITPIEPRWDRVLLTSLDPTDAA